MAGIGERLSEKFLLEKLTNLGIARIPAYAYMLGYLASASRDFQLGITLDPKPIYLL